MSQGLEDVLGVCRAYGMLEWAEKGPDASESAEDFARFKRELDAVLIAVAANASTEAIKVATAVIVGSRESGGSVGLYQQTPSRKLADGTTPQAHYGHGCSVDPAMKRGTWTDGYSATEGHYQEDEMGG